MRRRAPNGLGRHAARALLASVCILYGCAAAAQEPASGDEPQPLRIGAAVLSGYIQYDYRAVRDEVAGFYFRRVRVQLAGPLAPGIKWVINAEATGTPALRDAYIVLDYFPAATVRIGQLVMPYSHERSVMSANTMAFTERVLAELTPARDAGVTISNERPFFGWLSYAAAVHNGTIQNTRDNNGAKDVLGRLVASPARILGLGLGINAAQGEQPDGIRRRFGGDLAYQRRTYDLGAEFLRERTRDGQQTQDGFYVFGSWRFYPETAIPGLHHLEFATRYARLQGPRALQRWEFAGNYYAHRGLRFMFDVIVPAGGDPRRGGSGLHARANIRF